MSNQPICFACWSERNPGAGSDPEVSAVDGIAICHVCGDETTDGIETPREYFTGGNRDDGGVE